MNEKKKLSLTPTQAYIKAQAYCAYQERCQQEIRDKLYEWGITSDDVENIISKLISENFTNEERFAKLFVGGKFRIKKWGRVKIKLELKRRKISDYCIKKGLQEIDEQQYEKTLADVIESQSKKMKEKNAIRKNYRLGTYVISRGFEADLVWQYLKNISKT